MQATQFTSEQAEALQAVDEYEVRHNRKKAIAMSYRMGKAKDAKKHAHYIIQTIKKSIEASPGCFPTDAPAPDVPAIAHDPPAREKPKGGPLAKLAGIWCGNPAFWQWCGASDANEAAAFVKNTCQVSSRAELDHDPAAAALFLERIRKPFMQYQSDGS